MTAPWSEDAADRERQPSGPAPAVPARVRVRRRAGGSGSRPQQVHADLLWTLRLMAAGGAPLVETGPLQQASVGRRYLALPSVSRPRMLLPVDTSGALRAALLGDNGLRSSQRRAGRVVLHRLLTVAPLYWAIGDHLQLVLDEAATELPPLWVVLSELFGETVLLATSVHRRAPHRKPLFQVVTGNGRTVGYAKLGWNERTATAVDVEACALRHYEERGAVGLVVPRLLHHGAWGPHRLLVTAPLPTATKRYTGRTGPPPVSALRSVAPVDRTRMQTLGQSSYVEGLRARLVASETQALAHHVAGGSVLAGLQRLVVRDAELVIETGDWHGDWVPWNLAQHGREVLAWDWEYAASDVPVGFDCFHYHFEVEVTVRGRAADKAFAIASASSANALAELGLSPAARDLVGTLYLVEYFTRRLANYAAGGPVHAEFLDGLRRLIDARCSR